MRILFTLQTLMARRHPRAGQATTAETATDPAIRRRRRSARGRGMLAIVGLALIGFVVAPSPGSAGSRTPDKTMVDPTKPLSDETVKRLGGDLGIDVVYVLGFDRNGEVVVGVPGNVKIERFENQAQLWESKGRIAIKEIKDFSILRFQRNPLEYCFPYALGGSIFWFCITMPE